MSVVLWFQSTGSIPGNGDPVQMQGPSLTIGRGPENDLVLPDPDRVMSKRHCAIEDHNGNVVVVDMSTNGTFLNYGKLALGPTPTPLNDGDILIVGPYELLVNIPSASADASEQVAAPVEEGPLSHGVAEHAPSPADLLEAPGDGGDFLDDLLGGRDQPVGPGGVTREDLGDDGILPPLEAEEGILPPAEEDTQGASVGMHAPSGQDAFSAPNVVPNAIPDDWDIGEPSAPSAVGNAADPFASSGGGAAPGNPAFIPEDFELGEITSPPAETAPTSTAAPLQTPPAARQAPTQAPIQAPTQAPTTAPPVQKPTPQAPARAAAEAPTTPPITTPPISAPPITTPPVSAPPAHAAASGGELGARAFLKALGAEDVQLSDQELPATMSRLGHVFRMMVTGVREILMTRTSIKSEFRIKQTVLKSGGNNPLKFSISPEQAIEAIVKPKAKGYLDAIDAAEESLQDIKAHEVAMIAGMEAAIQGVLGKLEPSKLEGQIDNSGGLTGILTSRKARYWEVYKSMYTEISDQAESDFYELFAHEFARAYQEQLDKLK